MRFTKRILVYVLSSFTLLPTAHITSAQTAKAPDPLSQSPEHQRWDLSDLYSSPEDPKILSTLTAVSKKADDFAQKTKGNVSALSADELLSAIQTYEFIVQELTRIHAYAHLVFSADQSNQANVHFQKAIEQKIDTIAKPLAFFELEIGALDPTHLHERVADLSRLGDYDYWLSQKIKEKPHQLSEDTEKLLIDLSGPSSSDWLTLADSLTSQMRVKIGEEEMNLMNATKLLTQSHDPDIRQRAFEAIYATFGAQADTFAIIYNAAFKTAAVHDDWRHFEHSGDARHLSNGIDREDVDALVRAVSNKYESIGRRYYTLKAKWLGKSKLDLWDRSAPLPWKNDRHIPFEKARDIVLSAYQSFSPEFAQQAEKFFTNPWIDVPPVNGKALGASSNDIPGHHPFIRLNYTGTARDVITLAHEIGHGVHGLLSTNIGALQHYPPITLAETASIFGEILTFQHLLSHESDPQKRLSILASFMEDMISSTLEQINFHEFEMRVHEARKARPLSTHDFQTLWMETRSKIYGSSIALPENYRNGWMAVPHFRRPFYVYAYAFGQCLVNTLYQTYKTDPAHFLRHYFKILEAGGSKPYAELLAPLGLNPKDPAFWDKGVAFIESTLDEIEELDRVLENLSQKAK
jgi:oligoendopeptidase F